MYVYSLTRDAKSWKMKHEKENETRKRFYKSCIHACGMWYPVPNHVTLPEIRVVEKTCFQIAACTINRTGYRVHVDH